MVNMTLAVPEELSRVMKKHLEIKWSEIARRALWEHARKLAIIETLLAKSKLTEKDAFELGEKIKQGLHSRHFR